MKRREREFLNHEPDFEERQQHVLELSEAALANGLRRQLEGAVLVGTQLARIREQELYRAAECRTFEGYCCKHLQMSLDQVRRYLKIAEIIETLRAAGLELPMSEVQAILLSRLPRSRLTPFWRMVLSHCTQDQMALSDALVRRGVRFENAREKLTSPSGSVTAERAGVQVTLEC